MDAIINAVIAHFNTYNHRRYSIPWVCVMTPEGKFDFSKKVGIYTGDVSCGEEGDLVVTHPVVNQVYGYGQKDYRGNHSLKQFAKWTGSEFVACDRIGRERNPYHK